MTNVLLGSYFVVQMAINLIALIVLFLKIFVLDCMEMLCSRKPRLFYMENIHSKSCQKLSFAVTQSKTKEISDGTSN